MHFLPDSAPLGCRIEGPHVHVRRRLNSNHAYAKSRQSRWIPVEVGTITLYAEYRYERDEIPEAQTATWCSSTSSAARTSCSV
ncbi:hypothetical protein [Streptomyces sp. NPDC051636]|uniref:hypothetical protein n=1 Tax=Streptomyces sp. NPDC051636 TaxID=3365663 RepID=UPI0037891BCD